MMEGSMPSGAYISNETSPEDWRYLNEGGANTVYAFRDASHPVLGDKVLRIPKTVRDDDALDDSKKERRSAQLAFEGAVLPALISSQYLAGKQAVILPTEWLNRLEQQENDARPDHRTVHAQSMRTSEPVEAMLTKNLVGGKDIIAIEIKPKWGFLPCSDHLSPSSQPIKTGHCRFCLHRHYRRLNSIGHHSATDVDDDDTYCPLDLYSRVESRVERGVSALWQERKRSAGEANNLRVYLEGREISPEHDDILHTISSEAAIKEAIAETLMSSPLLSHLSQLQRSLDPVDIEGIQSLAHGTASGDAEKESIFANIEPRRPSAEDLIAFIDHWETWQSTARAIDQLLRDTPPDGCLNQYMVAYTLSATFKDCSLIIRYRFQTPDSSDQQNTKGERRLEFESITLIDMDIKPMRNLAKWAKLDRTIWQAYRDHPPSVNRRCVE